jgi:ribosome-binding protein aMBF1 (putative translation factor)
LEYFKIQSIGWIYFLQLSHFQQVKKRENKKLLKALGKRVRDLRKKQKISQAQLGYECGVHGEYIGRIERGEQSPTITTLESISKALGMKLKELIDFDY